MSNDYNGKKRSELPDSVFGIPQERKYPMPDEKHTRSAIKLFNHVDPKYEEQLAKAVIKNMKKYGIDGSVVGPNNRLRKYLPKDMIKESYIDESVSSAVSKDHKQKGYIKLSSLKRTHITEFIINKYKKEYPVLRHVRCKDTDEYVCDGYMWFKENDLVCYVGSCQYTDDNTKWIVSLEILPEYRGYGLSNQILDFCIKNMKCRYLSVNKNNELAKKIYDKYGFKTYHEDKNMYYMTLDNISSSNESMISITEKAKYDPPYTAEEVKRVYGTKVYKELIKDPAHKYRMDTGIELIHREPTKEELERIWKNWNLMSDDQKMKSDKKSIELFGKTNQDHYKELINSYTVNESVSILPQDTGISTVIFDIGDVLVSANIKDYLIADPEVSNEIVDELLKLWFIDKDEVDDTMDLDTYREIVNKRMGVEFSKYIPKLFQYNIDCVTAFDYTIPMIQDLKDKGYKVYYLSNWSAWTYDLLQEAGKFDFLELMDGGVFSYDVGYMKPNEEIYKILLNKYKINPEEAVFFDDREENIEAANKLGIHGVHFPRHDSSIVYNSLKVMQIAHEIFNISDSFKPCDMPEFITFSPKPALETVCMDIEIIPGGSVTQDDDGSVKVKSYNKRYYDYDTIMQSFIEAAKREDFPISIKNGNDRFEYTTSTKEKPYGEVGGVSISKGGFTEETIQEELAKHSIAIENQHMVAKSSMKIIKPVILNNDGYRKRAKDLNLKLRCDLLPVKGPTINIRVLDRYQNCEDPSSAKQLLDDIKESCITVANKLSGTFRYYVEKVTTDDNGCLNLHIKKMKVVSYNSDNEVVKEEDMEYPDFPIVLDLDSDITTVDIDKTLEESAVQEYGTTGGTIVGSNQPDSVYIVNYMQNNVFSGYKEPKRAICKKGMNQMYTTKNGKAIPVDIDKFKEEASDVSVFKFKGHPVLPYDKIIESASADDDFYLLLTGDTPEYQGVLEYDNRFIKEENFLNALEAIVSCTESTITGQENVSKYPYMKVLTESVEGRCWNYYRDINGVFAMNELTRLRTASYDSIDQISEAELRLIERGTVYLGE